MGATIRIGIVGYGNLGRGVRAALTRCPDMRLAAIFSRRDAASLHLPQDGPPVHPLEAITASKGALDVLILCGGSRQDLPEQGPALAADFCTVDSFDTHARIPDYFAQVDAAARSGGRLALISSGWDPGLFSLNRLMGEAIVPQGATYTFWGKGLSQGHSDAIRRVPGVRHAVQYTIPVAEAVERVRSGVQPTLSTRERHTRECFVVLAPGADAETVRRAIVEMPDYFADYDTTVHFVDEDTLAREHSAMPHGGFVIRSGQTGDGHDQVMEFSLRLQSNPEFTSSVLVAYARAVHRMHQSGATGAISVFDVPPGLLSPRTPAELRKALL